MILSRDSAGECPDCTRVWLALLEKGVAFDEKLVPPGGEEAYPAIAWDGAQPRPLHIGHPPASGIEAPSL